MAFQKVLFSRSGALVLLAVTFSLGFMALRTTPTFMPLVLLLAALQLYASVIISRPGGLAKAILLWVSLTSAVTLGNILPSVHALSHPTVAIWIMAMLSGSVSGIVLSAVCLNAKLSSRLSTPWAQMTLFPALWVTLWWGIATLSPIGRLATWSPLTGLGDYQWLRPYIGTVGIDWIVAAWSVACSRAVGAWIIGPGMDDEDYGIDEQLIAHEAPDSASGIRFRRRSAAGWQNLAFVCLLLALSAPPEFISNLPTPTSSSSTTPITVGCAIPRSLYQKPSNFSFLDEFINISKQMRAAGANIILWPEGAVRFENALTRDTAFERVRTEVPGPYIGVAYEEQRSLDSRDHRVPVRDQKLNGLTVIGPHGPVATYYKRTLVPVAESFSFAASREPPYIFHLNLTNPSGITKPDWNPDPPFVRTLPVTASICLDFATPAPFRELESRPGLILAPGRTWHIDIGLAMWEQARARAAELDGALLWCDGGEGGVSGVVAKGVNDIMEINTKGYWLRTIGIEWPFDARPTFYARMGSFPLVLFAWLFVGGLSAVGPFIGKKVKVLGFLSKYKDITVVSIPQLKNFVARLWRREPHWQQQDGERQSLL